MNYRTIRVAEEVWAELERRVQSFQDNPNRVLRRLLTLQPANQPPQPSGVDPRITQLLGIAGLSSDRVSEPKRDGSVGIRGSNDGTIVAYVHPQKRRLKVEIKKDYAEKQGMSNWSSELQNGWFNTGIASVYYYALEADEIQFRVVGSYLRKL